MATFLGTHITDFDQTSIDFVRSNVHGGRLHVASSVDEVPDTANGDNMMVLRIPVDAVIRAVYFACDALGAGTADIGFYRKNADGTYTAVDDDAIASAIAVTSAVAKTDITYEAGATNIAFRNQRVWERANLSARPSYSDMYIGYTFDTGTSSVATAMLDVTYTM